jgi:competence ComEA-like helix-hairpin-helix protein
MKVVFFVLFLLMIGFVSAACVDINSASREELIEITYIGEVRSEQIIEMRPFDSVEDLVKINGIGEKTLEKIIVQGLACVPGEKVEEVKKEDVEVEEDVEPIIQGEGVIALNVPKVIPLNELEEKMGVVYESKNRKILTYAPFAFSLFLLFIMVVVFWNK